ncbi:MAG: hypothetical protein U0441_00205 [Polyangiaceae bacterium]
MRRHAPRFCLVFSRIVITCALGASAAACAPDLTIGASSTTTTTTDTTTGTGGGAGTTATGGGGAGGAIAGGAVKWAQSADWEGDDIATGVVFSDGAALITGESVDADNTIRALGVSIEPSGFAAFVGSGTGHGGLAIAADPTGVTFVAGYLFGTTEDLPGDGSPVTSGGNDCLLWRTSPELSDPRKIGTSGDSACNAVATKDTDALFVAGTFSGKLDDTLGSGAIESKGDYDLFVARLDRTGAGADVAWSFGDADDQRLRALVRDGAGALHVLADDRGPKGHGGSDLWLLTLDESGSVLDDRHYGTADEERAQALAVGSDGTTVIAGQLVPYEGKTTPIDLGGGAVGGVAFLAAFDASHNHVWSHGVEDPDGYVKIAALVRDADGNTYVGGSFTSEMTVAGRSFVALGGEDGFVLKLDSKGDLVWAHALANAQAAAVRGLAFAASGSLIVAGDFQTEVRVEGAKVLDGSTGRDVFAMGIDP